MFEGGKLACASGFSGAATLSIAVGLVIAFLFAVPLMEQIYTDETQQRLETALSLAEGYATADGYQALAERVGSRAEGLRFSVIGWTAPCWGTAWADPARMGNHSERPEVSHALATGAGGISGEVDTGERQMYVARKVTAGSGETMIYRTALPLTQFGNVPLMLWGCAAIGIFMGLIVALFSANYSAGRVVEPLQELTKAARSISAGDIPSGWRTPRTKWASCPALLTACRNGWPPPIKSWSRATASSPASCRG